MFKKILFVLLMLLILNWEAMAQWEQLNGPQGAYVNTFLLNGTNLYIGAGSGVFLSTNKGDNWTRISNGLPANNGVRAMAAIGTNLFAAAFNMGVYLSTNNGSNWNQVNAGLSNTSVQTLCASGTNLFAGTTNGGIFFSSNNGTSWTVSNSGIPSNVTVNSIKSIGSVLFAATTNGLFKSTDNGSSWTDISSGLISRWIRTLGVDGSKLYVATWALTYTTSDNGATWNTLAGSNNHIIDAIAVSGSNVFLTETGAGVFKSTDNGATFAALTNVFSSYCYALAFDGTSLYVGSSRGFHISNDNGLTWAVKNNGLSNTYVRIFAQYLTGIYAASYYYAGVFSSTNNGTGWNSLLPLHSAFTVYSDGTNLYAGCNSGVWKSTDGASFSFLPGGPDGKSVYSIYASGSLILAGTENQGVYKSTDNGSSWTQSNTGLTNLVINTLAAQGTKVFAGTQGAGLFYSTDSGSNWSQTSLTGNIITLKLVNNVLYAGLWGGGVHKSTDNGVNWTQINSGLTSLNVYGMNSDSHNNLYVVAGQKLFFSNNGGAAWVDKTGNLPALDMWGVIVSGDYVYVGTGGLGVWKRPLTQVVGINDEVKLPSGYSLEQNYPNPFNPTTIINYRMPEAGRVSLKIFDLLGREIALLADGYMEAGTHSVRFDGTNLSSGIYVYQLVSGNMTMTRKMILSK